MIPDSRLEEAVARGIITRAQLAAILQLDEQSALDIASSTAVSPSPASEVLHASVEAPRGFNAVTVGYGVGAALVLFAFGWFLVDRWSTLGAGGVLAVALGYVAIFAVVGRELARRGFHFAAAVATLLVVGMTPILTWAILALTGYWDRVGAAGGSAAVRPRVDSLRAIPLELTTIVAASIALWRVRFPLLVLPIAVALCFLAESLLPFLFDPGLAFHLQTWMALLAASVLLLAGYAVDRHQGTAEDYATWIYLVGLVALGYGLLGAWSGDRSITPHVVAILSALGIVASLHLRRRLFLVFGALGGIAYLGYLAFDVFRRALGFTVVLAAFGLALILAMVWMQRRYPALARRVAAGQSAGRPALPGGYFFFSVGVAVSLVLLLTAPPRARRLQRLVEARNAAAIQQVPQQRVQGARDSTSARP